jgi:sialate O-acetylesterase
MIWYQGCTDAGNPQTASTYAERFGNFIARLRNDLEQPGLPVVITQLNRVRGPSDKQGDWNWSMVREQQALCARNLPHSAIVPTHDLGLSDAIHTSAEGNLVLASRYVQAALGLAGSDEDEFQPPELLDARLNGTRDVLTVTFSHVPVGLVAVSEEIRDFIVEEDGCAVNYTIPDRYLYFTNQVILHLAHPVGEKCIIRFCYGRDPESSLRRYRDGVPPLACMEMAVSAGGQT